MRLLLVEDEPRMAAALQRGLTHAGFAVDAVADGASALEHARRGAYDVMLLDIMLPKVSGYDVTRTLRREGVWTPILLMSAKDGEIDQADGLDLGADDYLTKPFSFVVLLARLRALIRRGAAPRPAVLVRGPLSLDPATREVRLHGTVAELTAREFATLECLMRRSDEVVPKAELLARVWGPDETDTNVVEVYVGYLRRKLGRDVVRTVRGVGYALGTP